MGKDNNAIRKNMTFYQEDIDKMNELDINEYNQLIFKAEYAKEIKSQNEFANLIKQAINKQIGSEIAGIQAIETLVDQAIERGHSDTVTPMVLVTEDLELAKDLLRDLQRITNRVFVVGSGMVSDEEKALEGIVLLEDTEKKTVKAAFREMRKSLKTK